MYHDQINYFSIKESNNQSTFQPQHMNGLPPLSISADIQSPIKAKFFQYRKSTSSSLMKGKNFRISLDDAFFHVCGPEAHHKMAETYGRITVQKVASIPYIVKRRCSSHKSSRGEWEFEIKPYFVKHIKSFFRFAQSGSTKCNATVCMYYPMCKMRCCVCNSQ